MAQSLKPFYMNGLRITKTAYLEKLYGQLLDYETQDNL